MDYLMSIFLGMLPEVIFFTLFLVKTKDLKEKKIRLGILIGLVYFVCVAINLYKLIYHVSFIFLVYLILKLLYKKKAQVIDIFVFSIAVAYLTIISLLIYIPQTIEQYYICLAVNRILLFVPFIFRNKFNIIYKKYCSLWNRNYEKKQPVKSITLRNISLISINCIIFLINIICIYILNMSTK